MKSFGLGERGFILVVLGTVFLAPWIGLLAYDAWLTSTWQAAPLTPVRDLQVGQTAKVSGTLFSTSSVAFGGHDVRTRSGWAWEWNTSDEFTVTDLTGTIRVVTRSWWTVANGPHLAGYSAHGKGTVYLRGDTGFIVGHVAAEGNGTAYLEIILIGPTASEPAPSALGIVFAGLFVSVLGPSWIWVGVTRHRKRLLHANAVRFVTGQPVEFGSERQDTSREWRPNTTTASHRTRGTLFAGGVVASALLVWTFLGVARLHSRDDYVALSLIVMFLSFFPNLVLAIWLVYGEARPSAVAFSEDGFHIWYDNAYDRLLQDDFIAWTQVKTIELRKAGKTSYWALERTTGEVEDLDKLSSANLRALREEWKTRTARTSSEGASPASR